MAPSVEKIEASEHASLSLPNPGTRETREPAHAALN
jgi:hypothetical protein